MVLVYKEASRDVPIEMDPRHDGEYVRKAFLIEGCLNLGTIPIITHPRFVLPYLLNRPGDVNSSTVFFARLFGIIVVAALSPGLFIGARRSSNAIESRCIVYIILGGAELLMVPMLLNEARLGSSRSAVLGRTTAIIGAISMAIPLVWRLYVLFIRPDLLGRYREVKPR